MNKTNYKNSANKRLVKMQINKQIRLLKCKNCRFRNKVRREWCYFYDRRLLDIGSHCTIDPENISQNQIQLLRKRKLKNRSVS